SGAGVGLGDEPSEHGSPAALA
ncbi:MAG: hypothetical protein QOE67_1298, partial [Solirubrobacteraceae bacterium]|nr:hypothetical protein [Solirubrobacteraceae bacterium]